MPTTEQQTPNVDSAPRDTPRLYRVANFAERHRTFTSQPSVRAQILNAAPRINSKGEKVGGNGLQEAGAIVRLGRRVLIDEEKYFAWLAQQQRATRQGTT